MLNNEILNCAHSIYCLIGDSMKTIENIYDIKLADGRLKNSPEYSKISSYIYFLYNKEDEVIYIGETGQKLKNRLFSDGSGAHKNKEWFDEIAYLKYYKDSNMDDNIRKAVERLLIAKFVPIYNDMRSNRESLD